MKEYQELKPTTFLLRSLTFVPIRVEMMVIVLVRFFACYGSVVWSKTSGVVNDTLDSVATGRVNRVKTAVTNDDCG